jgi:hypothetical protein
MYMTYKNKVTIHYTRLKKFQIVSIFWYDSKLWLFFKMKCKFIFIQQWLTCDILRQLNVFLITSYKRFYSTIFFIWKDEKY